MVTRRDGNAAIALKHFSLYGDDARLRRATEQLGELDLANHRLGSVVFPWWASDSKLPTVQCFRGRHHPDYQRVHMHHVRFGLRHHRHLRRWYHSEAGLPRAAHSFTETAPAATSHYALRYVSDNVQRARRACTRHVQY